MQGEQPVLAVEHAQHAVLLGDLQEAEVRGAGTAVKVKRFSEVMITAPGMAGSVPASLQSR